MKILQCEQSMPSSFSSSLLKHAPSFRAGSLLTSSTSPITLPARKQAAHDGRGGRLCKGHRRVCHAVTSSVGVRAGLCARRAVTSRWGECDGSVTGV